MRIDIEIAFGPDNQIDPAVLAQVRQHVVEKANAAVDLVFSDAVQIQLNGHVRGQFALP
jgi:hypothetical protein